MAVFVMFVSEGVKKRGVLLFSPVFTKFSSKIQQARSLEVTENYAIIDEDDDAANFHDDQF